LASEKLKLSSGGNEDEQGEGTVSDTYLDDIIGTSYSSTLKVVQQSYVFSVSDISWLVLTSVMLHVTMKERDPPDALQCDLCPY
jgi:hypothetical protein